MSISNLRFDEGIAKINSNDNKPLDTLITEKTDTITSGQTTIESSIESFSHKMKDYETGVMFRKKLGLVEIGSGGFPSASSSEFSFCAGKDFLIAHDTTGKKLRFYDCITLGVKNKEVDLYNVSRVLLQKDIVMALAPTGSVMYVFQLLPDGSTSTIGSVPIDTSTYAAHFDGAHIYTAGYKVVKKYDLTLTEVKSLTVANIFDNASRFFVWGDGLYVKNGEVVYKVDKTTLKVTSYATLTYGIDSRPVVVGDCLFSLVGTKPETVGFRALNIKTKELYDTVMLKTTQPNYVKMASCGNVLMVVSRIYQTGVSIARLDVYNSTPPFNLLGTFCPKTGHNSNYVDVSNEGIVYVVGIKDATNYVSAFMLKEIGLAPI